MKNDELKYSPVIRNFWLNNLYIFALVLGRIIIEYNKNITDKIDIYVQQIAMLILSCSVHYLPIIPHFFITFVI